MLCLSRRFTTDKNQVVPIDGPCPKCSQVLLWGDVIRHKNGCYQNLNESTGQVCFVHVSFGFLRNKGYIKNKKTRSPLAHFEHCVKEGRKEMFYLTTYSTHFIYGYMVSYI